MKVGIWTKVTPLELCILGEAREREKMSISKADLTPENTCYRK